ncbi:MAG: energy-coupling factor ABC transporter ATP-binding protein [Nitrososphaerales archaeon]
MNLDASHQVSELKSKDASKDDSVVVNVDSVDYAHPNGVTALKNVSLSVRAGELIAILGTNGAGKSTLVRHMNGILKPTRGTVTVFGHNTRDTTAAFLSRKVGIVFQNPNNQLFAQTVSSEIEFALRNFGYDEDAVRKRVDWALNTFSLSEYSDRPPLELSGGEKKRLCVALVLAWDPEILILDEPTVGQDSEQKEKLAQIILLLLSQKKTVILVTHDVEFIWPLQPRVILMTQGRVTADGNPQSIFKDALLTRDANVLPPQLVEFSKIMSWNGPLPKDQFEASQLLK